MLRSETLRRHTALVGALMWLSLISPVDGGVAEVTVDGTGLGEGLLRDSDPQRVSVYVPPDYETSDQRYPVLYLYHGFLSTDRLWTGGEFLPLDIGEVADELIEDGLMRGMIVVMPNAATPFLGTGHSDGSVLGPWETFLTERLVQFIDANYRTLSQAPSRGVAGHSGGGYAALKHAFMHPEVYGAVYSMSACCLDFEDTFLTLGRDMILDIVRQGESGAFNSLGWQSQTIVDMAAGVAPNLGNPPYFADFPLREDDGQVVLDGDAWERWLRHDVLEIIPQRAESIMGFRGIQIDVGIDDALYGRNQRLSEVLDANGISHRFETYDGNHFSHVPQRVRENVLPFFSAILSFELQSTASIPTSWAQVKVDERR